MADQFDFLHRTPLDMKLDMLLAFNLLEASLSVWYMHYLDETPEGRVQLFDRVNTTFGQVVGVRTALQNDLSGVMDASSWNAVLERLTNEFNEEFDATLRSLGTHDV